MTVNSAFLVLDVYVESVCPEKMMVKHRKAVLGGNLRGNLQRRREAGGESHK